MIRLPLLLVADLSLKSDKSRKYDTEILELFTDSLNRPGIERNAVHATQIKRVVWMLKRHRQIPDELGSLALDLLLTQNAHFSAASVKGAKDEQAHDHDAEHKNHVGDVESTSHPAGKREDTDHADDQGCADFEGQIRRELCDDGTAACRRMG
ncbi:unnamed protein product [Protopolystoma xenopodis]|uniref:Uncharacterized protein n=1 Tax=Protopolystoma xenopodis TaxID=117903 RepID=A0A3S5ACG2_9PLAT|nr:unnamed protein product [Protopolystoma xenopodis]